MRDDLFRQDGREFAGTIATNTTAPTSSRCFARRAPRVIADTRDLTETGAAEALILEAGHVDILIANLARPFTFAPAQTQGDDEMTRLMEAIFYPLHRLVRAVLPQMPERQRGKIVVVGSTAGIKGISRGVALCMGCADTLSG